MWVSISLVTLAVSQKASGSVFSHLWMCTVMVVDQSREQAACLGWASSLRDSSARFNQQLRAAKQPALIYDLLLLL
jgi:hypothetical protein